MSDLGATTAAWRGGFASGTSSSLSTTRARKPAAAVRAPLSRPLLDDAATGAEHAALRVAEPQAPRGRTTVLEVLDRSFLQRSLVRGLVGADSRRHVVETGPRRPAVADRARRDVVT